VNVLALCAGIGGLELGLAQAGVAVESCLYVEAEPYAAAVLATRVASGALAPGYVYAADLATLDVGARRFDLVTAGFPCQPASAAGKRQGRADERWIWPSIARIIADAAPRYVLVENVRGLLTVDGGLGFREVLESLAACGLDARWGLLRAADVGAPHRRERVFILAGRDLGSERVSDALGDALWNESERGTVPARAADGGDAEPRHLGEAVEHADRRDSGGHDARLAEPWRRWLPGSAPGREGVADPDRGRREGERLPEHRGERGARRDLALGHGSDRGLGWPPGPKDAEGWERWLAAGGPAPAVGGRLNPEFVEALMGYPPGWTDLGAGGAARRDRLRCLGNAVVPAQAALAWEVLR
jgi:DNA (cytosine-5)-methyltransferase 1